MAVFGWFGTSALLAGLFRLGWGDHSFRAFLKDKYVPAALRFDDPGSYVLFLLVISFAVLMGMALEIPRYVWRGLRSWWAGVTSGLALFTFGFTLGSSFFRHQPQSSSGPSQSMSVCFSC